MPHTHTGARATNADPGEITARDGLQYITLTGLQSGCTAEALYRLTPEAALEQIQDRGHAPPEGYNVSEHVRRYKEQGQLVSAELMYSMHPEDAVVYLLRANAYPVESYSYPEHLRRYGLAPDTPKHDPIDAMTRRLKEAFPDAMPLTDEQREVLDDRQLAMLDSLNNRVRLQAGEQYIRERAKEQANDFIAAEKAKESRQSMPRPVGLDAFLAVDDEDATYRIGELLPTGGRALLAAQYKAGKTTLTANLIRALVDGKPFLGRFDVDRADRVTLIDNEIDERMLRRWLRDQGIVNTERVSVVSLRGRVSSFDVMNPSTRALWAEMLTGTDVVILDCLRPVLDALGLSEDKDAGKFLVAFDELLKEAEISEAVVVHHMGHNGERSRGDSRLLDWPDVLWKIVREADKEDGGHYFSAFGRDVKVREGLLDYTELSRELNYVDSSRKDSAGRDVLPALVELLRRAGDGLTSTEIEQALKGEGYTRQPIRSAVALGVKERAVLVETGERGAHVHTLNPRRPLERSQARLESIRIAWG